MALSANMNVMMKTARRAGRALVKDFGEVEQLQVSTKGPGDFVSRADRMAEQTIREALMEARPMYGFIGEEGGAVEGQDPTRRWIVDPLDGTTNFLHGLPHWCISIALEHKGAPVAGVVYNPVSDEMFYAEKGEGAWLNNSRLRVSGRRQLNEAVFGHYVPAIARRDLPVSLQELARIAPQVAGLRQMGAAALDLCFVAAGRLEGFWHRGLKVWDIAAAIVIVTEAGGLTGPIRPGHDPMTDGDIIAANAEIFDRFAALIRERSA